MPVEISMLQTISHGAAEISSFPSLSRIRAEYLEMPGLALTLTQAARLWGSDCAVVEPLLRSLVDTGFLWRTDGARYVRRTDSPDAARRLPARGLSQTGQR
jgi:hypothetical protein